jgi:uncharacterized YigZ family protein
MERRLVPAGQIRCENVVVNSRFISTAAPVFSVEEAKEFIARMRLEFHDATHNVPAYIIGHGSSLITHCSDDGEPSGTAGRPALAVLSGSGLGDVGVVVTRYFGGTKLGTGGLVRAYSDAVRQVLAILPRAEKTTVHTVLLVMPYNWFERMKLLIADHRGQIEDQDFAADVTLTARFPVTDYPAFESALQEASHATLHPEIIATSTSFIPLPQPP